MTIINEGTAWDLLRALPRGAEAWREDEVRIHHPHRPATWLAVQPSGRWSASAPPDEAATLLLDLFLPLVSREEVVVGQLGQGLDGRIATESGHSHYVTGREDIVRLHRLRALADAVVVGAGTVASDDPRLTVREVEGENPVRVLIDPDGRLSPQCGVFTDGAAPTLVVRRVGTSRELPPGAGEIALEDRGDGGTLDPAAVVDALRARGLHRILVEGGGVTVSRFLEAGALDRLHVTVAPVLMGSGRPALTLDPIETLDQALRPPCRHFHLGQDVLFDLDLRSAGPA